MSRPTRLVPARSVRLSPAWRGDADLHHPGGVADLPLPGRPGPASGYAELWCRSNFSFLTAASHPQELVTRAAALGYQALALTDECSLAGVVRAHLAALEHGLALIIGSEIALEDGPRLVLLASDQQGYRRLSTLITRGRRRAAKGRYLLRRADLDDGLPGCLAILLPQPQTTPEQARWLAASCPGRAWIGIRHGLEGDAPEALAQALDLVTASGLRPVAVGGVRLHSRRRRPLLDLLTAIRLNRPLHRTGLALPANGECHLRRRETLGRLYAGPGQAAWLAETLVIAARCRFRLGELRYHYPDDDTPPGESADQYLRRLTNAGLRERWPQGAPSRVSAQIEHELTLIAELGYAPYFLTVHDIVREAGRRGILCQGRGSAANSAVCYCLGITAVDPARSAMLFERFISRERGEPPDIDVDFEHERREEIIQYIYARYGRDRAALTAAVISYRRKSALRDTGRALGLDGDQLRRLGQAFAWWDPPLGEAAEAATAGRLREAGLDPANPRLRRLLQLAGELTGFPRHLSQHVGGFVITRGPLCELLPIENAAMPGRTLIQWDKDDLDALGVLKIDILALGMLSAIRRCLALIRQTTGQAMALAGIPAEDPATYRMIQCADTVGVFQIESRAQMSMLPRLRPATFYDLVIQVAIVRPGPIQGDMVHPYLRRRRGEEPVSYPSPQVEAVLARTLGVPIFQEQVIQLAMVAAGFDAGEADALRRAMAAWRRKGGLEPWEQRLMAGMRRRGYAEGFARRIYQQICGFGEYGFPESHAASFALLAYASAWLKCHHPAAYGCALLNSQPMGFYSPAALLRDAREHGVEIRPVDVRHSDRDCTLEPCPGRPPALRLGLRLIKGLSEDGIRRLLAARAAGRLQRIEDLDHHARLDRGELGALAESAALAGLAGHRHQAQWQVLGIRGARPGPGTPAQGDLFQDLPPPEASPLLRAPSEAQDLIADYHRLGLSLGRHPLALLRARLQALGCRPLAELAGLPHGSRVHVAGLVSCRQRPGAAAGTHFITIEDDTAQINVIVWPGVATRQRHPLLAARLLGVRGTLQRDGEVLHLIARQLQDHSPLLGALETRSRDFH